MYMLADSQDAPVNVLLLGNITSHAKALKSVGANVTMLWDSDIKTLRNIEELKSGYPEYQALSGVDSVLQSILPSQAIRLSEILCEKSIDVIHANSIAHLALAWTAIQLHSLRGYQKPLLVLSIHNSLPWLPQKLPFLTRVKAHLIKVTVDGAVPIAEVMKSRLQEQGISSEKIITVPNCIDVNRIDSLAKLDKPIVNELAEAISGGLVITYVAAMHPFKGHQYLLAAAQKIAANYSSMKLILVGDGDCRTELQRSAENLAIADRVIFLGNIQPDYIPQLLALTDVYVCPSTSEVMPFSILEAMTLAIPVIASNVGGIPEVIKDGVSGYLVAPRDPNALATAICNLLENPVRRLAIGQAARAHVLEHHSLCVVGQQLLEAYWRLQSRTN